MESEFTAQSPLEGARCLKNRLASVKKADFVAEEYGGATLRIYGVAVGPKRGSCNMLSRLAGRRQPVLRPQLRRFRNTTRSSVLLYHLLLFIQHAPIDTLVVLAKRCILATRHKIRIGFL